MLDLKRIRQDFPILQEKINGYPLAYLDNAATTQKPRLVVEKMRHFYYHDNANIHRGFHTLAERATAAYEKVRQEVARFLGAKTEEIIFVRNTTEAINLVAFTWGRKFLQSGDRILLTEMEHHANIVPWLILQQEKGFEIEYLPFDEEGELNRHQLRQILSQGPPPKLFAFTHASNVLGTINPLRQLSALVQPYGTKILLDAAQSIAHQRFNLQRQQIDFLAFSGHKIYGPTGVGVLWVRQEILEQLPPFLGGGGMIEEVGWENFKPLQGPGKFEAGTPSIAAVIGLGAALEYLSQWEEEDLFAWEKELTAYAYQQLQELPGLKILGPGAGKERAPLIAFSWEGFHGHDLTTVLDTLGVAVRAGHHCAMPLHRKLGLTSSTRASFAFYNQKEEIDRLLEGLKKARQILAGRIR